MGIVDGVRAAAAGMPTWGWGALAGGGILIFMAHRGNPAAAATLDPNNAYPAGTAAVQAGDALGGGGTAGGYDATMLASTQNAGNLALANANNAAALQQLQAGGAISHQAIMDELAQQQNLGTMFGTLAGQFGNAQPVGNLSVDTPSGFHLQEDNSGFWANQLAGTQGAWQNAVAGTKGYWDVTNTNQQGFWQEGNTSWAGYWAAMKAQIEQAGQGNGIQPGVPAPALPIGANAPPATGNPPAPPSTAAAGACPSGNFSCIRYACPSGNFSCAHSIAPWLGSGNPWG